MKVNLFIFHIVENSQSIFAQGEDQIKSSIRIFAFVGTKKRHFVPVSQESHKSSLQLPGN